MEITAEYLHENYAYDPETGILRDLKPRGKKYKAGRIVGCVSYRHGKALEIQARINGKLYRLHRLIWLFVYGEWPAMDVDHIDGDPTNNRLANLRLATDSQNLCNRGKTRKNKSGRKGVSWYARDGVWQVHIRAGGRNYYLGRFNDLDRAHAAYCEAAARLHGNFAKLD